MAADDPGTSFTRRVAGLPMYKKAKASEYSNAFFFLAVGGMISMMAWTHPDTGLVLGFLVVFGNQTLEQGADAL